MLETGKSLSTKSKIVLFWSCPQSQKLFCFGENNLLVKNLMTCWIKLCLQKMSHKQKGKMRLRKVSEKC